MVQRRAGGYAEELYAVADGVDGDDNGPRVACPFCDTLIPLRRAIGPHGRKPLDCPWCEREISLPGEPD